MGDSPEIPIACANRRLIILVGAVMGLAGFLRLACLNDYPRGVNHDELSNMYDGWSIARTGADRSGRYWPILCYGFGPCDNRPAMFAWLCAGVSRFTGFSVPACRGVSVALAGLWGWRLSGSGGAILSMLILAVSPWHVLYSRIAHEGMALTGMFSVAIVLSLRDAAARTREGGMRIGPWLLAGFVIGLSTNAYGATRLTGLLFAVLGAAIIATRVISLRMGPGHVVGITVGFTLAALVGAGPQIYVAWTEADAFWARAGVIRLDAFGWFDAAETFVRNLLANLHPRYLFLRMDTEDETSLVRCSFVALPFFYGGLLALVIPHTRWIWVDRVLLLAAVLICVSPAAVTRTNPHALRASGCAVLFPMITMVGVIQSGRWALAVLEKRRPVSIAPTRIVRAAGWIVSLGFLAAGASYVVRYVRCAEFQTYQQQPELVELGRWLAGNGKRYDRVYIEPTGNGWDLYVAAFGGMTPTEFQQARREVWGRYNEFCTRLNQFYFVERTEALRQWERSGRDERWLIVNASRTFQLELLPSPKSERKRDRGIEE